MVVKKEENKKPPYPPAGEKDDFLAPN